MKTTHQYLIYFVTDQIQVGDISVMYCPSDEMAATYFRKSLYRAYSSDSAI